MGPGGDVGLYQARPLEPSQPGGWEAGRLEVCRLIKRKRLFPARTERARFGGEDKGTAGTGMFTQKTVSSYRSGGRRRFAASLAGRYGAADPLTGDPVPGEGSWS